MSTHQQPGKQKAKTIHQGYGLGLPEQNKISPSENSGSVSLKEQMRVPQPSQFQEKIDTRISPPQRDWKKHLRFSMQQTQELQNQAWNAMQTRMFVSYVSRWSVFGAWMVDAALSLGLNIVGGLVTFTTSHTAFKIKLVHFFQKSGWPMAKAYSAELGLLAHTFLLGGLFLFITQAVMVLFLGSSLGRISMGIKLEPHGFFARFFAMIFVPLNEILSVGGLIWLPVYLLFPKRIPLYPWFRLREKV